MSKVLKDLEEARDDLNAKRSDHGVDMSIHYEPDDSYSVSFRGNPTFENIAFMKIVGGEDPYGDDSTALRVRETLLRTKATALWNGSHFNIGDSH